MSKGAIIAIVAVIIGLNVAFGYYYFFYEEELPTAVCGDGFCDPDQEDCESCPDDCGECQADVLEGFGFRRPLLPVTEGETFAITVYAVPAGQTLGAFKLSVDYDASILRLDDQIAGDSWSKWFVPGIHTLGHLVDVQSMNENGVTNTTNLFNIKFTAISHGIADLDFASVECTDESGNYIILTPNSNTIEVNQA